MQYRRLGKDGPEVSILGFGAMRLPIIDGDESKIDEPEATRVLRYAIDKGINYVDTAWGYHGGNSEPWLGNALKDGYREKVYLATKLPLIAIEKREDCDRFLNEQLERLQTDYIDFYLLHAVNGDLWDKTTKIGIREFLDTALEDGRIRYAGFSFHGKYAAFEKVVDEYDWSFCQIQYNFMDQEEQAGRKGLEYAAERDLGIVIMEPLRGGNLAKEPPEEIKRIWDNAPYQRSYAEWALRWIWDHSAVSIALSGMNTISQVEENIALASEVTPNSLSPKEHEIINNVKEAFRDRIPVACTQCNYCMPCPAGVNIPISLKLYNDAVMYKNIPAAARVYNIILKSDQQAPACTDCGECEEKCPQEIAIRDALKKAHAMLGKGSVGNK